MAGWEPGPLGMGGEVLQPDGTRVGDQHPEHPEPLGRVADAGDRGVVHPGGQELGHPRARWVEHAESAVAGIDEARGALEDSPQDPRQRRFGVDRDDGVEELTELLDIDALAGHCGDDNGT